MARAIALAQSADAPRGANPRVGCVIIDADGREVGAGHHRGAGTPHAEVEALRAAGPLARGATAVVSLEPCRHVGRTGPCTTALIEAGITRVVFAQDDPTDVAGGGADVLRGAGIEVIGGVLADEAAAVNADWVHMQRTGRPVVVVKMAVSLDGRVADASGGPTAISGPAAGVLVHELRAQCDAIAVGTGTLLADDPRLTARDPDGRPGDRQPLRVVIGTRPIPDTARVRAGAGEPLHLATRDLVAALDDLVARGVQRLLVEGGPTLTAALLDADLVDEVVWVVAPRVLGAGPVSVPTLVHPVGLVVREIRAVGDDVVVIATIAQ